VSIGIAPALSLRRGIFKRAPLWIRRFGFEWLWRLTLEPFRLGRRYLIDDLEFFSVDPETKMEINPF